MNRVEANRLLLLARRMERFVEPAAPKKGAVGFDMATYFSSYDDAFSRKHPCGTAACLLGHACFIPSFHKLGLRLSDGLPFFEEKWCKGSGMLFFGLTHYEAHHLFYSRASHQTPKAAARAIYKLVREYFVLAKNARGQRRIVRERTARV